MRVISERVCMFKINGKRVMVIVKEKGLGRKKSRIL